MTIKCRKELNEMKSCMEKWYNDEGFRQQCAQMYLEQRKKKRLEQLKQKYLQAKREEEEKQKAQSSEATSKA